MDDEFDLHANLDSEPLMADPSTSTPSTSFYKSTTFKVLIAMLVIIAVVFIVSYFWGSKSTVILPPNPIPIPMHKTEHEKIAKTISKNELYEVMKASDKTQQDKKKELITKFKQVLDFDIDAITPDKVPIVLSAKSIYERLLQEPSYIPNRSDIQTMQYCVKMLSASTKTVTINPVPIVCKPIEPTAKPSEPTNTHDDNNDDDDDDDNTIIEIGKKSPLDDLDQ
jgi:hypothetical protein